MLKNYRAVVLAAAVAVVVASAQELAIPDGCLEFVLRHFASHEKIKCHLELLKKCCLKDLG